MKRDIIILSSLILIGAVFLWVANKSRDKEGFPDFRGQQNVPTSSVTFKTAHHSSSDIIVRMPVCTRPAGRRMTISNTQSGNGKAAFLGTMPASTTTTGNYGGSNYGGPAALFTSSSATLHTYGGGGSMSVNTNGTRLSMPNTQHSTLNSQLPTSLNPQLSTTLNTQLSTTLNTQLSTFNYSHRTVAVYDPSTGKYYDDETGEECPAPSGTYVGQVDPNTGLVWNGSAWVTPPQEVQPVGNIPWVILILMIIGYCAVFIKVNKVIKVNGVNKVNEVNEVDGVN